ncbi:hypothetical protein HG531_001047 [Fusarium graminearum]|nr:hypothetical protein HG531_001047 [Fusarium graminearum]
MHAHCILGAPMFPASKDTSPRRNHAVGTVADDGCRVLKGFLHHGTLQHVAVRWSVFGYSVEDAKLAGFCSADAPSRQGHLSRSVTANDSAFRSDDEVEVGNHLESASHGQAIDSSDDGLLSAPTREAAKSRRGRVHRSLLGYAISFALVDLVPFLEVHACAECTPGTCHYGASEGGLVVVPLPKGFQLIFSVAGHGIESFGSVKDHKHDMLGWE